MTNRKMRVIRSLMGLFFGSLLIFGSTIAAEGAAEGVELCVKTVIPSLFPFFVVSAYLTGQMSGTDPAVLRPISNLLGIPAGCQGILLAGFLGGYPVGAGSIAQAFTDGTISKQDASRLLFFCNNAGPAFIFGISASLFRSAYIPWVIWLIHISSALLCGLLVRRPPAAASGTKIPGNTANLTVCLSRAVRVTAGVCGWIILCRVLLAFLRKWLFGGISDQWQVFTAGLLELANGCCSASAVENPGARFILLCTMLGFGGICVALQTASVTGQLGIRSYLFGKLFHGIFSFLLSAAAAGVLFPGEIPAAYPRWMISGIILIIISVFVFKNYSRNPVAAGV